MEIKIESMYICLKLIDDFKKFFLHAGPPDILLERDSKSATQDGRFCHCLKKVDGQFKKLEFFLNLEIYNHFEMLEKIKESAKSSLHQICLK